ncbi:MAG: hypothetical protein ACW98X_22205 [Promethearchaeota archaeon]|jgi:hypothetical protein
MNNTIVLSSNETVELFYEFELCYINNVNADAWPELDISEEQMQIEHEQRLNDEAADAYLDDMYDLDF